MLSRTIFYYLFFVKDIDVTYCNSIFLNSQSWKQNCLVGHLIPFTGGKTDYKNSQHNFFGTISKNILTFEK